GICWKASVMSVRFLDERGRGGTADAIAAIEYAIHEGAKIVNCSFGTSSKSSALQSAVADATSSDKLAAFSNYGSKSVDVAAPGDHILSTVRGGGYGYKSGTSMAA